MTNAAKRLLEAFDSLQNAERQEVLRELLRRAAFSDHESPGDDELVSIADELFIELDRRESVA